MTESANRLFVGLDLDYTALDTDKFFQGGVLPALADAYPDVVDPNAFQCNMDDHRYHYGSANSYDFFEHIESLGLSPDIVEALIQRRIASNDLLRPGVQAFVETQLANNNDLHLVTLGEDRYQRLKINCVPLLAELSVHTLLMNKGTYLKTVFGERQGFHVDDAEVTDLPPGIVWLQVTSRKSKYVQPGAFDSMEALMQQGPIELTRRAA